MTNKKVRMAMFDHGLRMFELARILNTSETTLYRRLRDELSEEEQNRIIKLIEENKDHE